MTFRLPCPSTLRWTCALTLAATGVLVPQAASHAQPQPRASTASDFASAGWGDQFAGAVSLDTSGRYQPQQDPGSLYTIEKSIGVRDVWSMRDGDGKNITGQGVGVAVLDSGVAPVPGLDAAGKLTLGPDLSVEENGPLTQQDTFGHGTFMAGIIAGRGTDSPSSKLANSGPNVQVGIAPDAGVLALKLANTDGSTDVSQVIAGLDWVTQHQVMPDGRRIRVVNLSYGTDSMQPYELDPLAAAAENAWQHGLVVVVSAGNEGATTGRLTDPAIDPYVLAVGAADSSDKLTGWIPAATKVADFSSVGDASRHPDLIAPGTSVVSLRAPNSTVDVNNPSGRVAGDGSATLFRGSGTSQAAAMVSGAAALLLQAYPNLTPDQVKAAIVASASPIPLASPTAAGAGMINVGRAMIAAAIMSRTSSTLGPVLSTSAGASTQSFPVATGQGSIQAARGDSVLFDPSGADLSGEIDVQGNTWDPAAWRSASASLTAWSGGNWLGNVWTGADWSTDTGLSSARWSSARWSSARWSDASWDSARWSSARWSSARWSSARWSSARWSLYGD